MCSNERPVLIAVLTYRRSAMLSTLLGMLRDQVETVDRSRWAVEVLVVDNDADASARDVVESPDRGIHYVVEPEPGIARARNRALDAAAELGTGLLVFIDDDEEPEPGWLNALLATSERHPGAAVSGKVVSRFEGAPDPWLVDGGFYARAHRQGMRTGDGVSSAATNNLLLDLSVVAGLGLRFDETLGLAGGEDTRFTLQLTNGGGRIVWCEEAEVVDVVTPERATRKAALRRVFSGAGGSVAAIIASRTTPSARAAATARYAVTGVGRIALGGVQAVAGTLVPRSGWQARGVRTAVRGAGALSGLMGKIYQEYSRNPR